jgi:curved DNA-binding protein CbpA
MENCYRTLGVHKNASAEAIREAYIQKARVLHPDKGGCHEDMIRLSAAFQTLGNASSREMHDVKLAADSDDDSDSEGVSNIAYAINC